MNGYHKLTEQEIIELRKKIVLPKIQYPHYEPVSQFYDTEIYNQIRIERYGNIIDLEVSNHGNIKYNGQLLDFYYVGAFLNCAKVKIPGLFDENVYELVKLAFDPIENRELYDIHHINNNALDNRPENLIYLTRDEHFLIHNDQRLQNISRQITKNNRKDIYEFFKQNYERSFNGSEILLHFKTSSYERVKYNVEKLVEENKILRLVEYITFEEQKFMFNENNKITGNKI